MGTLPRLLRKKKDKNNKGISGDQMWSKWSCDMGVTISVAALWINRAHDSIALPLRYTCDGIHVTKCDGDASGLLSITSTVLLAMGVQVRSHGEDM